MSNKKLSEKELQQLKDFQVQSNNIVFALGQLYLREVFNKESKDKLIKDYKALNSQSDSIARDLQEKYGEGSIDLEKGEFIKSEYFFKKIFNMYNKIINNNKITYKDGRNIIISRCIS